MYLQRRKGRNFNHHLKLYVINTLLVERLSSLGQRARAREKERERERERERRESNEVVCSHSLP